MLMCGLIVGGMSMGVFADDFSPYESYDEFEESGYGIIYNTDKVKLESMPVYEAGTTAKIEKPVVFDFYNTTKQEYEFSLTSQDGMLPEAELTVDQEYMVTVNDSEYAMPHQYFMLDSQGRKRIAFKHGEEMGDLTVPEAFELTKIEDAAGDLSMQNRRDIVINVVYYDDASGETDPDKDLSGLKVRLIGQYETIEGVVTPGEKNMYGYASELIVNMPEEQDFTVVLDSDEYVCRYFPVTQKFHPEFAQWGMDVYASYDHRTCDTADIYVSRKEVGPVDREMGMSGEPSPIEDEAFVSEQGNVSIRNMNAHRYKDKYEDFVINSRTLDDVSVDALEGRNYIVMDIDAINMYRHELCKFCAGDFEYTVDVPEGAEVEKAYYINDDDELCEIEFTQEGSKIKYNMDTLSRFNNVFLLAKGAEDVEKILNALPEDITDADADAIKEAREIFDNMSEDAKAAHPELEKQIKDAETQLELYTAKKDAEQSNLDKQAAEEKTAAVIGLSNSILDALILDTSDYTGSSAKAFKAAVDEAIKVLNTSDVDTATILDAADKIDAAKKALVEKSANTMKADAKAKTVKAKKLKKAAAKIAPIKVTTPNGKVTYTKVKGNKKLSVNKTNGKITVKKGTRKGTYKMSVKVAASGDADHKAAEKIVNVTVKVK